MTAKRVLISGGAGFIGSNLALNLLGKGYDVTVLDNLSPQIHSENSPLYLSIKDKVRFIKGDVRSREDWASALDRQDVVVHLAAETGTGQSMYDIGKYVEVNVMGTAILLDYLTNHPHQVRKLVVASSRSIYGEGKYNCDNGCGIVYPTERQDADMQKGDFTVKCPHCGVAARLLPTDEESRLHPSSIYGITKQVQEQMVLTVGKSLDIPAVAFRYQNVYGPGQSLSNPYTGILSIFSTRIKNGNDIDVYEDGLESRDFVYIDDVVDATVLAIENDEVQHEVFNVGFGDRTNVMDVANALLNEYGGDTRINITGNYRLGDIRDNYADLTRIAARLGFSPKVDFAQGIKRFAQWVNAQEVMSDGYETSVREMKERGLFK